MTHSDKITTATKSAMKAACMDEWVSIKENGAECACNAPGIQDADDWFADNDENEDYDKNVDVMWDMVTDQIRSATISEKANGLISSCLDVYIAQGRINGVSAAQHELKKGLPQLTKDINAYVANATAAALSAWSSRIEFIKVKNWMCKKNTVNKSFDEMHMALNYAISDYNDLE